MRIALLSVLCVVACTGPGLEPPNDRGSAGTGVGSGGEGGLHGGTAGNAGSLGSGGQMASGGQGGVGGMMAPSGGQGGASGPMDAGVSDDAGGVEIDETRDLDTGWSDACGSVTNNGHCVGEVFEWCDYFARGLKQLDCGALGMTCQAGLQPGDGVETNGCVGQPCTAEDDERCDGHLRVDCHEGYLLVTDCEKMYGPASACEAHQNAEDRDYVRCAVEEPCDLPNVLWCDRELKVICDEARKLHIVDCQAHAVDGQCIAPVGGSSYCEPEYYE